MIKQFIDSIFFLIYRLISQTGTKTSDFFRGTYAVTLKNTESAEEPEIKSTEDFFQVRRGPRRAGFGRGGGGRSLGGP